MRVPWRRSDQFRKRDDGPVYLTPSGLERLKRELARLEAELPAQISEVQLTRSHGDLSDNAEYKEAKFKLRRTQARIAILRSRIARAVVITKDPLLSGVVHLGSSVTVEVNGRRAVYEIVGPLEADPLRGKISHVSPLGSALVGHRAGDVVVVPTPSGVVEYVIIEVL